MALAEYQLLWAEIIWQRLSSLFKNSDGEVNKAVVAGFMGNLQAESALCPYRAQGGHLNSSLNNLSKSESLNTDPPYQFSSLLSQAYSYGIVKEATKGSDGRLTLNLNGRVTHEFVYWGPGWTKKSRVTPIECPINGGTCQSSYQNPGGFGLAQWTSSGRKQNYAQFFLDNHLYYKNIGSIYCAVDYLIYELKNFYPHLIEELLDVNDIQTASNIVLTKFERPADQSDAVKTARSELGKDIYKIAISSNWTIDNRLVVSDEESWYILANSDQLPKFYASWGTPDQTSNDAFRELAEKLQGRLTYSESRKRYYIDDICIPFSAPDKDDIYFNNSGGGISRCIVGNPTSEERPNTLNNCVGAAWGSFNKALNFNAFSSGLINFLLSSGNGGKCLSNYGAYGLLSDSCKFTVFGTTEYLGQYIKPTTETPPIGGLVSWDSAGGGHLAFIAGVVESKDADGNVEDVVMYTIESGYNSPNYSWVLRSRCRKDGYKYKGVSPVCFLANPSVVNNNFGVISLNIAQMDSKNVLISYPPPYGEEVKRCYLKYKWVTNDGTTAEESVDLPLNNSIHTMKKLRVAKGIEARLHYNTLSDPVGEGNFSLVPSYPTVKIMHEGALKDFVPLIGNQLYVPIIKSDGVVYALFNTDIERLN